MALKAYSLARDGALHLTPHFRVREFACRDGSDPIFVEEELAALLEAIRLHFGCPVAITSGFRTAAHNASIPGASPHSQHLYGRAADFRVEGVSVAEAAAYDPAARQRRHRALPAPQRPRLRLGTSGHPQHQSPLDGLRAAHPAI